MVHYIERLPCYDLDMTMCNRMPMHKFLPRIQRTIMPNPIAALSNK